MNAASAKIVGKSELAALLGWSRTRLDRRIESDPAFPVARRGGRAGGWEFDVDQVRSHVARQATIAPAAGRKPMAPGALRTAGTGRKTVGKKELCALLGWSRMRLDRRLKEDPVFPVTRVGDQSGGWGFDPVAVEAHLAGKPSVAPLAIDTAQLRDALAPSLPKAPIAAAAPHGRRSAHHAGEATARQRKDAAQAALLELKLGIERGKYMPAEDVRELTTAFFVHLVTHLDRLPERIVKQFDLPDIAIRSIGQFIEDARTEMLRDLEKLCSDPKSNPAEGGNHADEP